MSAQLTQPDFEVKTYRPLPFGTISLSTLTPGFRSVGAEVYLTGPDGFFEHYDVGETALLEGLLPGFYSLAATDDTYRLVEGKVEVRPGEAVAVDVALSNLGGYYADTAALDVFGLFGIQLSDWYERTNRAVIAVNVPEASVGVTGPDGYHRVFVGEQSIEVGGLNDGIYSVAATAPGFAMVEAKLRVANGQSVLLDLTLEPLE